MSLKKYSLSNQRNTKLSEHFSVWEFASVNGDRVYCDSVVVETKLIDMLELLFERLNCSKIRVNSGYRCPEHDKAVGGNGTGQHTKGTAADIVCYDNDGKVISSKIVCCVAQDLNFPGIANINNLFRAVHLDMRSTGIYKGDESKGTNNVTDDFYKYFNIKKGSIPIYQNQNQFGIEYSAHCQTVGWQGFVSNGQTAGTTGQSRRLEALKVKLVNCPGAYLEAKTHIQSIGWTQTQKVTENTVLGTTGQSKRLEAVVFYLKNLSGYKLQYRVHVQSIGWTNWIDDAKIAGTTGQSKRIEAIQMRIVKS
ncbi:MAG: D-Ala-D-Ala carboxypeptidase family metallohydrolase [bacterium]|nr:D-Ala-D-Ala carboxypeptidase family metallohydrolase [bacterium]